MESAPRHAYLRAEHLVVALWRAGLHGVQPVWRRVLRPVVVPVTRVLAPWLAHAWWAGGALMKSVDPKWKNPYKEVGRCRLALWNPS